MAARKAREAAPPTQLSQLEARLTQGIPPRGVVLRGDERYFRERGVELIRDRARALEWEISMHDSADPDFEEGALLDDLAAGSLFSGASCVVVRNAASLLKKSGRNQSALTRAVQAFLGSDQVAGSVVLCADNLRADHAVVKAVQAADGAMLNCRKLWDSPPPWKPDPRQTEVVLWILSRARDFSVKLTPDQAVYVAVATGNDLYALDTQLKKLRHAGQRSLREVVQWEAGGSPFQVAEALVGGERARALAGVEALFRGGFQDRSGARVVDEIALMSILMGAIGRSLRQGLAGSVAAAAGADPFEGASKAGLSVNHRGRDAFMAQLKLWPPGEWRARLDELADLERRAKTGGRVDGADFVRLACRWSKERAAASQTRRGRSEARAGSSRR